VRACAVIRREDGGENILKELLKKNLTCQALDQFLARENVVICYQIENDQEAIFELDPLIIICWS
jgi:hypothetical protein